MSTKVNLSTNFQTQPLARKWGSNYPCRTIFPGAPGNLWLGARSRRGSARGSESVRCWPVPYRGAGTVLIRKGCFSGVLGVPVFLY